jgi:energy-coupling factor transporter ATP-binding protein EcfA2
LQGVRYWYPGDEKPTLDGIDLGVNAGEMVVLIGASGGGKSTLMLSLNGIVPKDLGGKIGGKISVAGLDPLEHELHEMATKVGFVFQDPDSQLAAIFVRDEVGFGPQNLLLDRTVIEERMAESLDFVGMTDLVGRDVFSLSGGEKQRVAIASVLAMQPDLIVLDEPTANLDPVGAQEIARLVGRLRDAGQTLLLVEHQINDLARLADRLVVLQDGRIRFNGTPRDVLREHGAQIRDELGLWIPQASEFGLALERRLGPLPTFPLTTDDLPERLHVGAPPLDMEKPASSAEVLVEADGLGFQYRGTARPALEGVSFTLRAGEAVALLGKNGSGKSTLGSLLVGLLKPGSGSLLVCGQDAREAGVGVLARSVSYVFQYPEHQFVSDTVFGDIAYGLERRKVERSELNTRATKMLDRFRLLGLRDRHPFKLSMGEKRRLSVADMLVTEPRILILDEPTAGQDRRNTLALVEMLNDLRRDRQLMILVITHDMNLVGSWCERALVLDAGKLVFDGPTRNLFADLDAGRLPDSAVHVPETWRIARRLWPDAGSHSPLSDPQTLADAVVELH